MAPELVSSFTPTSTYHVFLSFSEDTSKTFSDHLYEALHLAGFRTFLREEGIEIGEKIDFELEKAIQNSRISIVVFSKDYASSTQCLDELLIILRRTVASERHVMPVFYDVDPSEVRNLRGSVKEALKMHEERFQSEASENKIEWMDKIKAWKTALTEIANLAGLNLGNQADGCKFSRTEFGKSS
ncbi:hypothetical protein NMG60_11036633 [Bertholletia excelsa]